MPNNAAGVLWRGNFNPLSKQPRFKITISTGSNEDIPIEYKYWHSYTHRDGDPGQNANSIGDVFKRGAPDWTTGKHDSEWFSEDLDWHAKNKFLKKIDGKWVIQKEAQSRLINSYLWLFRPKGGFQNGERYTFTATNSSPRGGKQSASVTVTLSNTSLYPLDYRLPLKSFLASKRTISVPAAISCAVEYQMLVNMVSMSLPDEFARFRDFLFFETIVDISESERGRIWKTADSMCDAPIPGQSKLGKGKDLVFDTNTVQMRAYLPGTDVKIETTILNLPSR